MHDCASLMLQALCKSRQTRVSFRVVPCKRSEHADAPHALALLRARRERPCPCCAAEQHDKFPPVHSITSSARASNVVGTSRPSALAVLRLIHEDSSPFQEQFDLFEHAFCFGVLLQRNVILSWQRYESCPGYSGGKLTTRLEWLHLVFTLVHDKRRYRHLWQQLAHIEVPGGLEIAVRAFGRSRLALPLREFLQLLRCCARHNH